MKHWKPPSAAALAACLGVVLLAGCSAAPDLDDGAARGLQDRVAAAKQLAVEQDYRAALGAIDQLDHEVATAADQGLMSAERRNRIEAAISAVKADLEAAAAPAMPPSAPAPAPAPAPEPSSVPPADGDKQKDDGGKDAEKRQEEAQKKAEEQQEEAQKQAEEQLEEAQKQAEKGKDGDKGKD